MPWRMGYVFRPAPSIGELRSGSPRLVELNDFVRQRYSKGLLDVLSFSESHQLWKVMVVGHSERR
uniref:Uncharacterized protein n=1 Tax=Aegilops tauschii subsp. strangulata TaxID=200361 RepID=A0A453IYA2_AEGTS